MQKSDARALVPGLKWHMAEPWERLGSSGEHVVLTGSMYTGHLWE
jgi:hypothetical protein